MEIIVPHTLCQLCVENSPLCMKSSVKIPDVQSEFEFKFSADDDGDIVCLERSTMEWTFPKKISREMADFIRQCIISWKVLSTIGDWTSCCKKWKAMRQQQTMMDIVFFFCDVLFSFCWIRYRVFSSIYLALRLLLRWHQYFLDSFDFVVRKFDRFPIFL